MIKSMIHILWKAARKIFYWIYKAYRAVAITIGTLLMFGWTLLLLKDYNDRYISLPNGYQMVPKYYNSGGVLLLDRDGTPVVTSVEDITWCNDVIYGRRRETVDQHPAKSCGTELNCAIQVDYMFLYDGKNKTLRQYETNVFHVIKYGDGDLSEGRFSAEETFKFNSEIKKRNLPAFDSNHAVEYSSIIHGEDIIPKGEFCRTSNGREPHASEPMEE